MGDSQEGSNKIILMGMDNAGKSTIVRLLRGELEDFSGTPPDIKPTRGLEVSHHELYGKPVAIWDFGGHEMYRNEYIKKPDKYFQQIAIFFYVVDVQDVNRFYSSKMYFTGVFQLIRKYTPKIKIVFLFHKKDPEFQIGKRNVKEEFLKYAQKFIKHSTVSYTTHDTTIYNPEGLKDVFQEELKSL